MKLSKVIEIILTIGVSFLLGSWYGTYKQENFESMLNEGSYQCRKDPKGEGRKIYVFRQWMSKPVWDADGNWEKCGVGSEDKGI